MRWLDRAESDLAGADLEAPTCILPMGRVSLVLGAWLRTDGNEAFARGVAMPCLILSLALLLTGATVGVGTPARVSALQSAAQTDAEAARQLDIVGMAGVHVAWPIYHGAWARVGVVGLLIDAFAERRAIPYAEALRADETRRQP